MPRLFGRRRTAPSVVLRVSVTEDDIARAVRGDSARNPIALALVRQLNVRSVRVSGTRATLTWNSPHGDVEVVRLPLVARMFMFSLGAPGAVRVAPFACRLAVRAVQWHEAPESPSDSGLPAAAREKAVRIRTRARALLGRTGEFAVGSRDLFIVGQLMETYLPETLASFVALHEELRDQPVAPDGRTARQVLEHELELIDAKLDEITADLGHGTAAALLVQERFLADQLGESPPGPAAGAAGGQGEHDPQ